jgi:hypothetical protein
MISSASAAFAMRPVGAQKNKDGLVCGRARVYVTHNTQGFVALPRPLL